jgi:hypothetical protein
VGVERAGGGPGNSGGPSWPRRLWGGGKRCPADDRRAHSAAAGASAEAGGLYNDITKRAGKNPAKSAVARKVLIAAWHVLSREQPFKPARPRTTTHSTTVSASSRCFLVA